MDQTTEDLARKIRDENMRDMIGHMRWQRAYARHRRRKELLKRVAVTLASGVVGYVLVRVAFWMLAR